MSIREIKNLLGGRNSGGTGSGRACPDGSACSKRTRAYTRSTRSTPSLCDIERWGLRVNLVWVRVVDDVGLEALAHGEGSLDGDAPLGVVDVGRKGHV